MPLLIRRLERADIVSSFDCGDQELNHYLQRFAWQNQQRHSVGTTYVAAVAEAPKVVIGFYTLAASGIPVASFPEDWRRRVSPYREAPVLLLARLAVDRRFQGRGVGAELLTHALELALAVRGTIGCRGVVVEAYPAAVSWYEAAGFVTVTTSPTETRTRKLFLDLRQVEKAKGGAASEAPGRFL